MRAIIGILAAIQWAISLLTVIKLTVVSWAQDVIVRALDAAVGDIDKANQRAKLIEEEAARYAQSLRHKALADLDATTAAAERHRQLLSRYKE